MSNDETTFEVDGREYHVKALDGLFGMDLAIKLQDEQVTAALIADVIIRSVVLKVGVADRKWFDKEFRRGATRAAKLFGLITTFNLGSEFEGDEEDPKE